MSKIIVTLCIGLIAGFCMSFLPVGGDENEPVDSPMDNAVAAVECFCDLQPVEDFDRVLQDERDANDLLRAEIDRLQAAVEQMAARKPVGPSTNGEDWLQSAWAELATSDEPADRRQQLIDGGFAPARAEWILNRESELRAGRNARNERHRDRENGGHESQEYGLYEQHQALVQDRTRRMQESADDVGRFVELGQEGHELDLRDQPAGKKCHLQ